MFRILALKIISYYDNCDFEKRLEEADIPQVFKENALLSKQVRRKSISRLYNNGTDELIRFYRDINIENGTVVSTCNDISLRLYNTEDLWISVNAIAGMNGSGKSTVIDYILRLLNNTAYALRAGIDNNDSYDLIYAEAVYAILYFETADGHYVRIEQNDLKLNASVQVEKEGKRSWRTLWEFNNDYEYGAYRVKRGSNIQLSDRMCAFYLSHFFYTIVVNHAAYAFNIADYRSEWIDYDEKEIIDSHKIHHVDEGYEPAVPDDENVQNMMQDEELCWIGALFHKNDSYQTPLVLNPYRVRGNVDYNREKELLNDRIYLMMTYNRDVITEMFGGLEPYMFEFSTTNDFLPKEPNDDQLFHSKKVSDALNQLNAFDKFIPMEEDPQRQRRVRMTVSEIKDKTNKIGNAIINEWKRCVGYELYTADPTVENNKDVLAALNYIVYKTIKSAYNYSKYRCYATSLADESNIDELVKRLWCDDTHITLKIRRALAFLLFLHYGIGRITGGSEFSNAVLFSKFDEKIDAIVKLPTDKQMLKYVGDRHEVEDAYRIEDFQGLTPHSHWIKEELLPAPHIMSTMLLMANKDPENLISFDLMSSGEKQQIYSISSMVYQLHHLNSASNGLIKYNCASIIFDEVDLYFHPDYQKRLIKYTINVIEKLNLTHIKHINIMLATHSPFILSDIPQNNILYLQKGEDVSSDVDVNPFGANINDILKNSFFLHEGFMGEFARQKIMDVINKLEEKVELSDQEYDDMEQLIDLIGEPLLRQQLTSTMLEKKYKADNNGMIKWMQDKIKKLQP